MAKKQALSLSTTEFERPVVLIDGEEYEMRSPDELSTAMMRELVGVQKQIEHASEAEDVDAQVDELEGAIRGGVNLVMPGLPDEIHSKLTFGHQSKIVNTFLALMKGEPDEEDESETP